MRKRILLIIGVAAVALACIIAFPSRRPTEPTYAGDTLTRWVCRHEQKDSSGDAEKAIRTMVSNSLPQIAELANYDPTARRMRYQRFVLKLPAPARNSLLLRPLVQRLWNPTDHRDESAALSALGIARPAATNTVKMLLDFVRTNGPACCVRSAKALEALDEPPVPLLTNLALNPFAGPQLRRAAIIDLESYTNEPPAFAFLTNLLQDPDRQIQAAAAEVLAPLLYQ